ncbi:hypothetical protein FOZ61_006703 [Perkinsus olseni]|uniref:Uncharacterized protein n=1 Tax=Perkinsus olseni TaxID=32597 RepID=A0A7J6MBB8_PEROL|nr:hypothetical protein FOZ61_006703 [Perkinsus olseni]KAF4673099.1 hypothetical protein FOL46_007805 [Perkinsus olseni]
MSITVVARIVHRGHHDEDISQIKVRVQKGDTAKIIVERLAELLRPSDWSAVNSATALVINGQLVPDGSMPVVDFGLCDGSTVTVVFPPKPSARAYTWLERKMYSALVALYTAALGLIGVVRGGIVSIYTDPWALVAEGASAFMEQAGVGSTQGILCYECGEGRADRYHSNCWSTARPWPES